MNIWLLAVVIMLIAFIMTMTGRGGGNFYVLTLVFSGIGMNLSASTGQFILMCSSLMAAILFSKQKMNHWKLTILLGIFIFISAMAGGFFGHCFNEKVLKVIFAVVMFIAALLMLCKPKKKMKADYKWVVSLTSNGDTFDVNLLVTVPIVLLAGFLSGMVGVSGGSFLVPLMLLTMNVPMHIAVGVSTFLVSMSAAAGFFGHWEAGIFDFSMAIPLALGGVLGGFAGAKMALKSKPKNLKYLFAGTQLLASVIMIFNVIY
ncbi:sulfite exporter TauE/SafE family protein [Saccharicrinis fermentans]|uniref:Probable membrane transporter protein n=1 Tax=Saccharicrinis fermentans DSM 9555 = JCM 21142 TaxID=869213 RepID=W7YIT9_9BACT|nr:sulfite exporter TauE/SafE family protein [Saccharicrinis fermentans]GAF02449.1 sulfite exporter TauE/SafE [Saccharicrinis fermentans DSM 9555 = JCM 21142]